MFHPCIRVSSVNLFHAGSNRPTERAESKNIRSIPSAELVDVQGTCFVYLLLTNNGGLKDKSMFYCDIFVSFYSVGQFRGNGLFVLTHMVH